MIRGVTLGVLVFGMVYLASAWFYFGAVHPCGIYKTLVKRDLDKEFLYNLEINKNRRDYRNWVSEARKARDERLEKRTKEADKSSPLECVEWSFKQKSYAERTLDEMYKRKMKP